MKIKGLQDTIAWYDQYAADYAKRVADWGNPVDLDRFVGLLPKGIPVLDAGCGSGRDTFLLSELGVRPIGLDLSMGFIEFARKQFPHLEFTKGDMRRLPFSSGHFNGVWAQASLVHFETVKDVRKALKEFHRVMKSGGILYVKVRAQMGKTKTAVVSDSISKHDRFFRYFTKEELEKLIRQAGFTPIFLEQYKESDRNPERRSEVEWITVLARKT